MKRFILLTSPPACGKNYASRAVSKALAPMTYLDKDTLIIMSKKIYEVAGEPYDRSSDFFKKWVRNPEYDCVMALAMDTLEYATTVLINAPFTNEIRSAEWMRNLRAKVAERHAILTVIFVVADPEIVHERMIKRNSDRDTWKLDHWDEYNAGVDYSIPGTLNNPDVTDEFFVLNNNSNDTLYADIYRMIAKMWDRN